LIRVAVISPYFNENIDVILECHASVARQTHPCLHVLVADGFPNSAADDWQVDHVKLPRTHGDLGSTPRLIGCYHAIGLGVDAVAFLDADNWYREDHIERLLALHKETGASFLSSNRMLCRLDGSVFGPCPNTTADRDIDTNCMMFMRAAFPILAQWCLMPRYAHPIGDQVMLHYVKAAGIKRAHRSDPSVYYRCGRADVYRRHGEPIPDGIKPSAGYRRAHELWVADGNPPIKCGW
jgi:glycosyltransferase involved in cell wall biosynthesis